MPKQHPLDRRGTFYSESVECLKSLQALEWEWFEDPEQYPFLRLIKGKGDKRSVSARSLNRTKRDQIVVGVGRQDGLSLVLAYRKPNDFTCNAYRDFPADPTAKPVEAVDTRILTGDITPEESLEAIVEAVNTSFNSSPARQEVQEIIQGLAGVEIQQTETYLEGKGNLWSLKCDLYPEPIIGKTDIECLHFLFSRMQGEIHRLRFDLAKRTPKFKVGQRVRTLKDIDFLKFNGLIKDIGFNEKDNSIQYKLFTENDILDHWLREDFLELVEE